MFGGLIGYVYGYRPHRDEVYIEVRTNYYSGAIQSEGNNLKTIVGLVSSANASINIPRTNYYVYQTTGLFCTDGETLVDIADIANRDIYYGFDFTNTWNMEDGVTMPYLKDLVKPVLVEKTEQEKVADSINNGTGGQGSNIVAPLDLFKKLQNTGKAIYDLADYGFTYTRYGWDQYGHNSYYNLGIGSGTGIRGNNCHVTIDYQNLMSNIEDKGYKKIYTKVYNNAGSSNGYQSWVETNMIVTYEDGTTVEEKTPGIYWNGSGDYELEIEFEKNKKVKTIEIIIDELDNDWGWADGYIKELFLKP